MSTKPTLNACLRAKRIYLNRVTITLLGSPTHLNFWYDEKTRLLCVSAASEDDLDAYKIPRFFWKSSRSCEIARIAFLKALQYRLNWECNSKYSYFGTLIDREGFPAIAFNMIEGTNVKRIPRNAEVKQHSNGCESADVGDSLKSTLVTDGVFVGN